jgi:hypothetical protein
MSGSHLCIPRTETVQPHYFQNRIIMFCLPIPTLIYQWEIYIFPGLVSLFAAAKYVGCSWKYWGRAFTFPGHKFDFRCSVRLNPENSTTESGVMFLFLYSSYTLSCTGRSLTCHVPAITTNPSSRGGGGHLHSPFDSTVICILPSRSCSSFTNLLARFLSWIVWEKITNN